MRTAGENVCDSRSAARDRSSLITSDGQEPTRNSRRISGRRAISWVTIRSSSSLASVSPAKILFFHDRGGEARLGKDHHAGRGLNQMGAGARTHHEEERVLDLSMQPDDAGQPAEHLALAALAADRIGRNLFRAH